MINENNYRKNKRIQFRVTQNEYERLRAISVSKGFSKVAEFVRTIALEDNVIHEIRFNEMYKYIKEIKSKLDAPSH